MSECPTKAAAQKRADKMRKEIRDRVRCVYFRHLAQRYIEEDMPSRQSTASAYRSNVKRLVERWGNERLDEMTAKPLEIQQWLQAAKTADGRGVVAEDEEEHQGSAPSHL